MGRLVVPALLGLLSGLQRGWPELTGLFQGSCVPGCLAWTAVSSGSRQQTRGFCARQQQASFLRVLADESRRDMLTQSEPENLPVCGVDKYLLSISWLPAAVRGAGGTGAP